MFSSLPQAECVFGGSSGNDNITILLTRATLDQNSVLYPNDNMSAHSVTTTTWPSMLTSPTKWFSRSEPEKTFWSKLCQDCRVESLDKSIVRPLGSSQAWDVAGPVLWHWNETLFPVIKEYFEWNRRLILRQDGSLASIDCWMVGDRITDAKPTVIITCSGGGVATRFRRLLKHDRHVISSGYDFLGRRGRLIATMGRDSTGSKDKAQRPASSQGANRRIEQPQPQRDQAPRMNAQDSSDASAISEGNSAVPLTRQPPSPSEVQAYNTSTRHESDNISISSARNSAEELSGYGLTPRTGAVQASELPELRANIVPGLVRARHVNPVFPRDTQRQNIALSSALPESASSHYQLREEGSKRALTSTVLSDMGRRFVGIGLAEFKDCRNFIRNHPDVLKEPEPDFLKTALEAIRDDRAGDAHRCIQQVLILRMCGLKGSFNKLDKLIAGDNATIQEFISDFKKVQDTLRDRAPTQHATTASVGRHDPSASRTRRQTASPHYSSMREERPEDPRRSSEQFEVHDPLEAQLHQPRLKTSKIQSQSNVYTICRVTGVTG